MVNEVGNLEIENWRLLSTLITRFCFGNDHQNNISLSLYTSANPFTRLVWSNVYSVIRQMIKNNLLQIIVAYIVVAVIMRDDINIESWPENRKVWCYWILVTLYLVEFHALIEIISAYHFLNNAFDGNKNNSTLVVDISSKATDE